MVTNTFVKNMRLDVLPSDPILCSRFIVEFRDSLAQNRVFTSLAVIRASTELLLMQVISSVVYRNHFLRRIDTVAALPRGGLAKRPRPAAPTAECDSLTKVGNSCDNSRIRSFPWRAVPTRTMAASPTPIRENTADAYFPGAPPSVRVRR